MNSNEQGRKSRDLVPLEENSVTSLSHGENPADPNNFAWLDEPDEYMWEHAGLPCAIMRNGLGAWCGYVGIPASHPLHGKPYNHIVVAPPAEFLDIEVDLDSINLLALFAFALEGGDYAADSYPLALIIKVHGGITYASDILPCGNEHELFRDIDALDNMWWFGFDCGHYGDFMPFMSALTSELIADLEGEYRTVEFAKQETEAMADQLTRYAELMVDSSE